MSVSRSVYFKGRIFKIGELAHALTISLGPIARDLSAVRFSVDKTLPDKTKLSSMQTFSDLETLCDLREIEVLASAFQTIAVKSLHSDFHFQIRGNGNDDDLMIDIYTSVDSVEQEELARTFRKEFATQLSLVELNPEEIKPIRLDIEDKVDALSERIMELEARLGARKSLRCFLSFTFDEPGRRVAGVLQHFLQLLNVEVVTGDGYQPRRIEDKIDDRLRQAIDFLVVVVTSRGQTPWTRDEVAVAYARAVPTIPVVEEGADWTPGILGNIEIIPFSPDHPGDALIKLLEGVRYIQETRKPATPDKAEVEAVPEPSRS